MEGLTEGGHGGEGRSFNYHGEDNLLPNHSANKEERLTCSGTWRNWRLPDLELGVRLGLGEGGHVPVGEFLLEDFWRSGADSVQKHGDYLIGTAEDDWELCGNSEKARDLDGPDLWCAAHTQRHGVI